MGNWKYIEPSNANKGTGELYNLENDIIETENLIVTMPANAQELKTDLDKNVDGGSSK
tara:strand:- start:1332 stop:1505 length:174 start_codon:yes stop_codon:yes gene_type:complete